MEITYEMLHESLGMFALLAVELTLLFLLISYAVGVLQEYIPPAKIQSILSSKNGKGYLVAGLLGAITPFCSCSTIPFLKGLLRAKAGFGTMMVFLFASPPTQPNYYWFVCSHFRPGCGSILFCSGHGRFGSSRLQSGETGV